MFLTKIETNKMGLIVLALAPVFIIAFYIYFRDKYEKEPLNLLIKAMLLGALITIPVIFAEQFISIFGKYFSPIGKAGWDAFMVAALCEEAFKYFALYLLIWRNKEFNEKFDGIVYASFVSLGFAGVENVLYVLDSGLSTGLTRAFTAVPAHAIFGVTMGFFFGIAKFYPKKRKRFLQLAIIVPILLHGIYDFILMSGLNILLLLFLPYVVYMWMTGFKKMKSLNKTSIYNTDIKIGMDFSKVDDYKEERNND